MIPVSRNMRQPAAFEGLRTRNPHGIEQPTSLHPSISLSPNSAKATDLKKRLWFTVGALIVFRFLSFVPLPGMSIQPCWRNLLSKQTQGGILDIFNTFSGGSLQPDVA